MTLDLVPSRYDSKGSGIEALESSPDLIPKFLRRALSHLEDTETILLSRSVSIWVKRNWIFTQSEVGWG